MMSSSSPSAVRSAISESFMFRQAPWRAPGPSHVSSQRLCRRWQNGTTCPQRSPGGSHPRSCEYHFASPPTGDRLPAGAGSTPLPLLVPSVDRERSPLRSVRTGLCDRCVGRPHIRPSKRPGLSRVDRGFRHRLSHPAVVVVHPAPPPEAARSLGTIVALDRVERCPVDVGFDDPPMPVVVLVGDRGWERVAEFEDLRNVAVQEFLAEVLVRAPLHLPLQKKVLGHFGFGTEEVDEGEPPPVQGLLEHPPLALGPRR